ncbi:MAG: peptide deformylase [Trueperella sp.]|nr:peptide deformylase [Trueperella sp.]
MIREIRIMGDPVLRTPCDPITEITPGVRGLVQDLLDTVDAPGRAGLAANQIGVSLRAFSWNIDGDIGYILNPVIVEMSEDEFQDDDEGCLSVPDLWYPCERAWYAKAVGTDLDGNEVTVGGEDIWGQLVQHEVDHLDGHLYIDRLPRMLRKKALREFRRTQEGK